MTRPLTCPDFSSLALMLPGDGKEIPSGYLLERKETFSTTPSGTRTVVSPSPYPLIALARCYTQCCCARD